MLPARCRSRHKPRQKLALPAAIDWMSPIPQPRGILIESTLTATRKGKIDFGHLREAAARPRVPGNRQREGVGFGRIAAMVLQDQGGRRCGTFRLLARRTGAASLVRR